MIHRDRKLTSQLIEEEREYLLALARRRLSSDLQRKISCSDLVQQTMLNACEKWETFEGKSIESLRSWLATILHRQYLEAVDTFYGSQKRSLLREQFDLSDSIEDKSETASAIAISQERIEALLKYIDLLPEDQKRIVKLRHIEHWSFEDIATHLQMSRHAVNRRWKQAINHLGHVLCKTTF